MKKSTLKYEQYYKIGIVNNIVDNIDLQIGQCGHEATHPKKEIVYSKTLPVYRLIYIESGSVHLFIEDKEIVLFENSFFILKPNKSMHFITDPVTPATLRFITFSGLRSQDYLTLMGFHDIEYCIYKKAPTKVIETYENCFKYDRSPMLNGNLMKNFIRLVELLYRNCDSPSNTPLPTKNSYVETTLQYINTAYANSHLSIKSIADSLFIHENYLSRLLKRYLGVSFTELLTQKRLEMALKLFNEGKHSVSEVAYAVGYENPLYFSTIFKKQNLISPQEYIKKLQSK